jgi:hypothetical protein
MIYSILLDQISLNRPMGIYPDGLHPAAVQAEHSPAMPADHEPWSTPPHVPFELTTARTCFLVTVAHDTPAAMALYAMASNQAPLHPIHHSPHRHLHNRHPPRLPTTPRHTSPRLPPSGDRPQTVGRVPGLHLPLRCRVMAAPATGPGPGTPKPAGQKGHRRPAPDGHQPGTVTPRPTSLPGIRRRPATPIGGHQGKGQRYQNPLHPSTHRLQPHHLPNQPISVHPTTP